MNSTLAHIDEFLMNADEIMNQLNRDIELWKNDRYNKGLINQIFRYMHSLKSGAAFLEMEKLEKTAHEMESLFDSFRKGYPSVDFEIENLYGSVGLIETELSLVNKELSQSIVEIPSESLITEKEEINPLKWELFTSFQKELIKEASVRGEKFYRIICHIDELPQMIYARAYLLMNNLELTVNVISTTPSMKERNRDYSRFTAYITTDLDERRIYRAVNVDSVNRVDLIQLDYSSYLEKDDDVINLNFDETAEHPSGSWIRVEQRKIDELAGYIDQLIISTGQQCGSGRKMGDLYSLAKGMENLLLNVTLVPLNSLFKGFPRFVQELCRKTKKSTEIRINCEQCAVDRSVLDILSETLQHLIRNAVYHGIETNEERISIGKIESGIININAVKDGDRIVITVSDDGRGINCKELFEEAEEEGFLLNSASPELLTILAKPGFSTVRKADHLSGRGVGLDLVLHNIQDKLNGTLTLENREGKGLIFTIEIPATRVLSKITIMRSRGRNIAIPNRNIETVFPFDSGSILDEQEGQLFYNWKGEKLPLFTESGKLYQSRNLFNRGFILVIHYLGLKAALYTDELLMEKEIVSDNLRLHDEKEPYLYKALLSGDEYLYLSPSIICS